MKTSWYMYWVVALLMVSPIAVGQTTEDLIWEDGEDGHLMTWIIYSQTLGDGSDASFSDNGTWLKFTSLDKAINESVMHVDAWISITIQSTEDGAWNYSFEASIGSDFSGCSKSAITRDPGVLGGSPVAYYSFPLRCEVLVSNATEDQSFTWWINRTVESGNPDVPLGQQLSVRLDRSDFVVYPMDINLNTAFDSLLPVIWLFVAWWTTWRMSVAGPRYLPMFLFSVLGFAASAIPDAPEGLHETALWGLLLGVLAVALQNRFGTRDDEVPQ